jgi:hypothetical protein
LKVCGFLLLLFLFLQLSHYSVSLAAANDRNPFCHNTLLSAATTTIYCIYHSSSSSLPHPIRYLLLLPPSVSTYYCWYHVELWLVGR